jgi:hypothetical protein
MMTEKAEPQDRKPDVRADALKLLDGLIADVRLDVGMTWSANTSRLPALRDRLAALEYARDVVGDPAKESRRLAQAQLREAVREFQEALNSAAWKDAWAESKRRLAALADRLADGDG